MPCKSPFFSIGMEAASLGVIVEEASSEEWTLVAGIMSEGGTSGEELE